MKIAIAQISTNPGDIKSNTKKIIAQIKDAKKKGAQMIIFPELSITGYMSLDLILDDKYIEANLSGLQEIIKNTQDILVIVGFIDIDKNRFGPNGIPQRFNSAAIIKDQRILAIQDKTLLPDYDVFFENRYFSQSRGSKLIAFGDWKIGVEICEDLWDENYPVKVSQELIKKGADMLINISASPFYLGKRFDRQRLITKAIKDHPLPFIYVNTVGLQDGYDGELVFDGESMVFNQEGELIYVGKQFKEELFYIETDELSKTPEIDFPKHQPISELFNALVVGIKDYFRRTGFSKAFIGVSGGIDSAVVATLAVYALGKENVVGIYMPTSFSSKLSLAEASKIAKNLGITFEVISIQDIYNNFLKKLQDQFHNMPFDSTEENIQARIRGVILMAHANKFSGLVINTANKTETALGYTTLYGDMCGAISPLADVNKLRVYELAKFINDQSGKSLIPKDTIQRLPTAELRENQTDEQSLGASYLLTSPLVDDIIEEDRNFEELLKKYPRDLVIKIISLINKNEYKRRQAAPAIKVTKKAFGLGRRIPIVHNLKNWIE